jgi:vancomycin permeability regulator SanA
LAFDEENDTIALTCGGFGTEESCITTIENSNTKTKAVLTEHFKAERAFVWISPWCLCPEFFKLVDLKKGEADTFVRSIEVGYCKEY